MSNQLPLYAPTGQDGRERSVPIEARLHARATDPQTSLAAAVELVESGRLTDQQEYAVTLVRLHGPGTTWEIARRHCLDIDQPEKLADIHYLLARRLPEEPERDCLVTCGRIKDEHGKTIKQDVRVCEVRGTKQAVWRVWRIA